jgi:hypothetical protein
MFRLRESIRPFLPTFNNNLYKLTTEVLYYLARDAFTADIFHLKNFFNFGGCLANHI